MKNLLFIIALASAAVCAATATVPDDDARKADYIFIEATNALNEDRIDDAYMLYRRAYRLNPADKEIASAYALMTLSQSRDSAEEERAYQAVRDDYFADPTNYYKGQLLVNVATMRRDYRCAAAVWQKLDSAYPDRSDPALNLADTYLMIYLTENDTALYRRAFDIYNRLEQGVGFDLGLISHKIRAYSAALDTAAIISELQRVQKAMPGDVQSACFIANTYDDFGMPDSARTYFDKAFAIDSLDAHTIVCRSAFYYQHGDTTAFVSEALRALKLPTIEFDVKLKLLNSYITQLFNRPEYSSSISNMFEVMQDQHPGESDLHMMYGFYLEARADTAGAIEQFGYASDLAPTDEAARYNKIRLYAMSHTDHADVAARWCEKAITDSCDAATFGYLGASIYFMCDSIDRALTLLDKVKITPEMTDDNIARVYNMRGDLLYQSGRSDSSYFYYEKALLYDPSNLMTRNNLAYHYAVDSIKLDEAERYISAVVDVEPDNPTYLDTYAWVKFKRGDYASARHYIDRTINITALQSLCDTAVFDDYAVCDTAVFDDYAVCDTAVYDYSDSVTDLAIVEDPDTIDAGNVMIDEAMEYLSAEVLEHAGDIYYMTGEHEQAVKFWTQASKLDADNELLRRKVKQKKYIPK